MAVIELADLVLSTRDSRVRDKEIRERQLVKVFRGYYLPQEFVDPVAPPWVAERRFSEARVLARMDSLGDANPGIATMESALLMWGLNTWSACPDIHYWRADEIRAPAKIMPSAEIHRFRIGEAKAIELVGPRLQGSNADTGETENVLFGHSIRGIRAVGLGEAAGDLTRFAHPLAAFYGVSTVLRHLGQYDARWKHESEETIAETRALLIERAGVLAGQEKERSVALLKAADPGIASPGEAQMLWLLHVLLRTDDRPIARFESQYEVNVNGSRYFIDIAFPAVGLALEFDGRGKMSVEGAENDFRRRHADLSRAGWKLRHFPSESSRDPVALAKLLSRDLVEVGLYPASLGGILWRAVPPDLLMSGRVNGVLA